MVEQRTENQDGWVSAPMWREWKKLTRLQWSGRIAFNTEVGRWSNTFIKDHDKLTISTSEAGGKYELPLDGHLETLRDETAFCGLILARSYSLLENHSKLIKYVAQNELWSVVGCEISEEQQDLVDAIELGGGIEVWSAHIMDLVKQDWEQVYGGKAGLVEISIVRNSLLHGYLCASPYLLDKARKRGCVLPFGVGEQISIDFATLHEYRGRIRSFCRAISDGVVHLARGTHRSIDRGME